jgi:hypothetical protein
MPFERNMPAAQDIPETQDKPADAPAGGEQMNPVIDALKTLQVFVASLKEKDPAKAQGVQEAMMGLLQAIQGGGGDQNPPSNETSAPEANSKPEAQDNQGAMGRAPSRPVSMNAGKNSKPVPIM